MAQNTQERIDEKAPNGGAYSIAYFKDADGDPTEKEKASSTEIIEFDKEDRQIFRTYLESSSPKRSDSTNTRIDSAIDRIEQKYGLQIKTNK